MKGGQVNIACEFLEESMSNSSPNDHDPKSLPTETASTTMTKQKNTPCSPSHLIIRIRRYLSTLYTKNRKRLKYFFGVLLVLLFHCYTGYALFRVLNEGGNIDFCNGVGFLLIVLVFVYLVVFYYRVILPCCSRSNCASSNNSMIGRTFALLRKTVVKSALIVIALIGLITYIVLDSVEERSRLISLAGIPVIVVCCWFFSKHPDRVVWQHVVWGLGLQMLFGFVILRWPVGRGVFRCAGDKVDTFLNYTTTGSVFVFGSLALPEPFYLAFSVLPVIIFFSFMIQILYYYGVIQIIVLKLGWLLQISVGTTAIESLNAAANIFLGQTEAPLLLRPFLQLLTMSELHAVMTGGFATIAGSVMAVYIKFGASPVHLLSASVMSAPAALAVSKLIYPEVEQSQTGAENIKVETPAYANALHAASQGAISVIKLCGYIAALLIAFTAFISFVNGVLAWVGSLVGYGELVGAELSFETITSLPMVPVAFMLGVPIAECRQVGKLLSLKIVLNEFIAYSELKNLIADGAISQRGATIATYALCGFANFASMGVQIGGIGALVENRYTDLARLAFSAMVAGNLACFLTACVAGSLITETSLAATASLNSTSL